MRASERVVETLRRAADWLEGSGGSWVPIASRIQLDEGASPLGLRLMRPRRFADRDALDQWIRKMRDLGGDQGNWQVHVMPTVSWPNPTAVPTSSTRYDQLHYLQDAARATRVELITVHFRAGSKDIYVQMDETGVRLTAHGYQQDLYTIAKAIDAQTVPLTRAEQRRGVSLLSPLDALDASQQEHEAEVARRAARIGGVWGLLSGLAGGAAATLATYLLTR